MIRLWKRTSGFVLGAAAAKSNGLNRNHKWVESMFSTPWFSESVMMLVYLHNDNWHCAWLMCVIDADEYGWPWTNSRESRIWRLLNLEEYQMTAREWWKGLIHLGVNHSVLWLDLNFELYCVRCEVWRSFWRWPRVAVSFSTILGAFFLTSVSK